MGRTAKQTALFDVRLKGSDHDVLVIKGSPLEAPSVLLSGTIVLSVLEPMSIKKLSLKLYATLRLKWNNTYETSRGTAIRKPYRYEKRVFEHNWDNFEIQNYFTNLYDNYSNKAPLQSTRNSSANSSSSSIKSFGKRSKSASSLVNLSSLGSSTSLSSTNHILLQGNYEFPFSAILPGSTLESVEGLPGASLVYKLQANIERGRFNNDLIAKKHLRIVRTLTPDTVDLTETMAVDNTWPKKVEYTISTPSKAIAIGSSVPISMLLVPLVKGLKLGKVKVSLVEYFSCAGSFGPSHSGERTITTMTVPSTFQNISEDRWEVDTSFPIPPSLSKCTQDVDILNNIRVRHKVKFVIGLVNPDGHISELRASLPIALFISPFVALGVKNYDRGDSVADNSLAAFAELSEDNEHVPDDDDVIFAPDPESTIPASSEATGDVLAAELQAPPNYGSHIYDRLWNEIPIEDTPEGSTVQTPVPGTPITQSGESLNVNRLTENLRKLHFQQRMNDQSSFSLNSAAMSLANNSNEHYDDDDDNDGLSFQVGSSGPTHPPFHVGTPLNETSEQDYFSLRHQPSGIVSPGVTSPGVHHISRANSSSNLSLQQLSSSAPQQTTDWDPDTLLKVPSYQVAMRSPTPDDLSPVYVPPTLDEIEMTRPRSMHLKSSSLANSRTQSTALLNNLRGGDSEIKIGSSPPMISRNASSSHVTAGHSRSHSQLNLIARSPGRKAGNTTNGLSQMTPLASSSESAPSSLQHSSRSTSFVNMIGSLVHKKEKK